MASSATAGATAAAGSAGGVGGAAARASEEDGAAASSAPRSSQSASVPLNARRKPAALSVSGRNRPSSPTISKLHSDGSGFSSMTENPQSESVSTRLKLASDATSASMPNTAGRASPAAMALVAAWSAARAASPSCLSWAACSRSFRAAATARRLAFIRSRVSPARPVCGGTGGRAGTPVRATRARSSCRVYAAYASILA